MCEAGTQVNVVTVGVISNLYADLILIDWWWRHQMETFSALLALCAGNSPVIGEFPAQRSVTRSFGVGFDLRLNKRLSKHSWGCSVQTPSHSLWRHCNVLKPCSTIAKYLQHESRLTAAVCYIRVVNSSGSLKWRVSNSQPLWPMRNFWPVFI